ncbi:unnamed protein product [Protopolystoma xenopodis]|uniref:Uncharacterized protein n=1 Tax=Protopolystoma xenopodis TaxID=117903 RepID=A0A448WIC0_9PLAT|nr:unnamed protein product [Protopolystoma xenopodis]
MQRRRHANLCPPAGQSYCSSTSASETVGCPASVSTREVKIAEEPINPSPVPSTVVPISRQIIVAKQPPLFCCHRRLWPDRPSTCQPSQRIAHLRAQRIVPHGHRQTGKHFPHQYQHQLCHHQHHHHHHYHHHHHHHHYHHPHSQPEPRFDFSHHHYPPPYPQDNMHFLPLQLADSYHFCRGQVSGICCSCRLAVAISSGSCAHERGKSSPSDSATSCLPYFFSSHSSASSSLSSASILSTASGQQPFLHGLGKPDQDIVLSRIPPQTSSTSDLCPSAPVGFHLLPGATLQLLAEESTCVMELVECRQAVRPSPDEPRATRSCLKSDQSRPGNRVWTSVPVRQKRRVTLTPVRAPDCEQMEELFSEIMAK